MMMLAPVLTPHGLLILKQSPEALPLESEHGSRLEQAFARGSGHGLLFLGADEVGTALPPVMSYWREFGARYVTALCALPGIAEGTKPAVPIPADGELAKMAAAVPPMTGAEYLTAAVLADLWRGMDAAFDAELADAKLSVQEFLKSRHPAGDDADLTGTEANRSQIGRQNDDGEAIAKATNATCSIKYEDA
jgi:hypothetical protein